VFKESLVADSPAAHEKPTSVLIKFCGLTNVEDARAASRLGAGFVGVILADSSRRVDLPTASAIFAAAGPGIEHVAVFGSGSSGNVPAVANELAADVVQLHGALSARVLDAFRRTFSGRIWAVIGVNPEASALPPDAGDIARAADGVVLDTQVRGRTGGTGIPFDWDVLADSVATLQERTRVILAGGLRADNVAAAVRALSPDVVDVSSGVERSPGKKDHDKMQAFAEVARSASISIGRTTPSRTDDHNC
jgi:phosphoribosylanthranilate isomerase